MNQETYNRIIESGQPMKITAELRATAQQNGLRQRSEALAAGWNWLRDRLKSTTKDKQARAVQIEHCAPLKGCTSESEPRPSMSDSRTSRTLFLQIGKFY